MATVEPLSRHPILSGEFDIVIPQGGDWSISVTHKDTDFTGFIFDGNVVRYPGTDNSAWRQSLTTALVMASPDGEYTLSLTDTQTAALDFGNEVWYYDVYGTSSGGAISLLLSGRVRLFIKG